MPKFKKPRVGFKLDMTPMVDVAFLLLTFFMLTTQFKPMEEVEIVLPSSNSAFKLPESDVMTVNLSKDGRIFLGLDNQRLRGRLFGAENELKASVEVPKDRLADMLVQARTANPRLRTVIKGDMDTEYGVVEDVIEILQKTRINRFNLVTNLERPEATQ